MAADWVMIADWFDQGAKLRLRWRTPLHAGASQRPSLSVSYLDCAISALAASTSPANGAFWYGRVVLGQAPASWTSGRMSVGIAALHRAAPGALDALQVHHEVHRLPDVDVVERRRREVHVQEPDPVAAR